MNIRRPRSKLLIVALAAWLLAWALVLAVNVHRDYIGRLGVAEWDQRGKDPKLSSAARSTAAGNADFELEIAEKARVWEWRVLLIGLGAPAALALLAAARAPASSTRDPRQV